MKIEYDLRNNSTLIQFCDDSQTEYVYTLDGEKLRTIHRTASPNITVGLGENKKLAKDEILESDSTDYIGNFIFENGKPDKYLFAGGFASLRNSADGKPEIAFHYYDQDHLGNNRAVVSARTGAVEQITNYYPFGMPYTDQTAVSPDFQKYKYNGKELDKMHGLNTYDYGARQYYSIVPAWDRIDPMCEKYYDISPYAYCGNNPENVEDPDGRDSYYTQDGKLAFVNTAKTDNIYIISGYKQVGESEDKKFIYYEVYDRKTIDQTPNFLSALAYSRIFTNILERYHVFDAKYPIYNNAIQVFVGKQEGNNIYEYSSTGRDSNNEGWEQFAHTSPTSHKITANIWEHGYVDGKNSYSDNRFLFKTEHNVLSILGDHEYKGHRVNGWDEKKTYDFQLGSSIYESTTYDFQSFIKDNCVKK